jgi:hypothetical protein
MEAGMTRRFLTGALGLGLACTLPLAACGDDDDSASDEFCDIARDLATQGDTDPNDPIFDQYLDAAPEEIKDDAALAIERIGAEGDEAFNDPDVVEAVENIEAFEEEECDITLDDRTGDEDDGDSGDDGSDETTTTESTIDDLTGTTEDTTEDSIDDLTGTTEDTTEDSIDDLTTPTN